MTRRAAKFYFSILVVAILTAITLSAFWQVPYIYTLIGFAAWPLAGHLITIDDDLPGGFSNPDGQTPFPWKEVAVKGIIFAGLVALALGFPEIRQFGG